jgi:hypothetical protein
MGDARHLAINMAEDEPAQAECCRARGIGIESNTLNGVSLALAFLPLGR